MTPFFHVSLNHNPPGCRNADIPHSHEHDEMLLCVDGHGGQMCGHRCVDMRAGNLFYFPPGMRHCSVFYPGHEFDCYVVDLESRMFVPAVAGDREMIDVLAKMAAAEPSPVVVNFTQDDREKVSVLSKALLFPNPT